ncbi:MAG: hypothetical protein NXI24_10850, partial [bacterium]|nr:hypothetical protein [bacterium]
MSTPKEISSRGKSMSQQLCCLQARPRATYGVTLLYNTDRGIPPAPEPEFFEFGSFLSLFIR